MSEYNSIIIHRLTTALKEQNNKTDRTNNRKTPQISLTLLPINKYNNCPSTISKGLINLQRARKLPLKFRKTI